MSSIESTPISNLVRDCARQLGRGELSALGRLFDAVGPRLLRYAETITRNREDAEDALQAAVIRVAQNPKRLAAARFPWAYFLRMTRNEALKIMAGKRPDGPVVIYDDDPCRVKAEVGSEAVIGLRADGSG